MKHSDFICYINKLRKENDTKAQAINRHPLPRTCIPHNLRYLMLRKKELLAASSPCENEQGMLVMVEIGEG
jgi:hypothetical protein